MSEATKRKAPTDATDRSEKRQKSQGPKKWQVSRKDGSKPGGNAPTLEVGDSGIWATCDKGTEGKCTAELRDIFAEYSKKLYEDAVTTKGSGDDNDDDDDDNDEIDIEAEISNEIKELKTNKSTPLFQPVRTAMTCVIFFKTAPPVDPVAFVHRICRDAFDGSLPRRARYIKRLTPVTLTAKATPNGLGELCSTILKPHFHEPEGITKKYAIRPSARNNSEFKRDAVIKQVADAVGSNHKVDLSNYDHCILVETFKNLCGMSIVGGDYEELKRFNLAEIWKERRSKERGEGGNAKEDASDDQEAIET